MKQICRLHTIITLQAFLVKTLIIWLFWHLWKLFMMIYWMLVLLKENCYSLILSYDNCMLFNDIYLLKKISMFFACAKVSRSFTVCELFYFLYFLLLRIWNWNYINTPTSYCCNSVLLVERKLVNLILSMHCHYQYTVKTFLKTLFLPTHNTNTTYNMSGSVVYLHPYLPIRQNPQKFHLTHVCVSSLIYFDVFSCLFYIFFHIFVKILKPFLNLNKNIFNGLG